MFAEGIGLNVQIWSLQMKPSWLSIILTSMVNKLKFSLPFNVQMMKKSYLMIIFNGRNGMQHKNNKTDDKNKITIMQKTINMVTKLQIKGTLVSKIWVSQI